MMYTVIEHLIEDALYVLVTGILGHIEKLHQAGVFIFDRLCQLLVGVGMLSGQGIRRVSLSRDVLYVHIVSLEDTYPFPDSPMYGGLVG